MEPITAHDPLAQTADLTAENLDRLRQLFPDAVTEDGVDFDVLRELLGGAAATGDERYGLHWHGKRQARQLALVPSTGTLRPAPTESESWDTTQNLMIEGDNLEVLKLLQKSYAGQVKLIYIDPPYNTGKDFVYPDNFKNPLGNYLELTGQVVNGEKMSSNTEASGRFHTDWLNMIYPRLKVARNLLREDGAILISIDDAEVSSVRKICDEIFGEENFCGIIKRRAARKTAFLSKKMSDMCDYVVIYAKSDSAAPLTAGQVSDGTRPVFNDGNNLSERIIRAGALARCSDGKYLKGTYAARTLSFELLDDLIIEGGKCLEDTKVFGPWRINQLVLDQTLFVTRNFGLRRILLPEELEDAKLLSDLLDNKDCYNEVGSEELASLLGGAVFSNPKPTGLISYLERAVQTQGNDIILDFFAGSGTTGHAVMAQNAADGGSRRYILVQLPEPLDPAKKEQKAAADYCDALGKPRTIAELTKERLRRAARKVQADNPLFTTGDLGFRVYRLASSNIKAWRPQVKDLRQTLLDYEDNLDIRRTDEDLLTELQLKLGLPLTTPVEVRTLPGAQAVHSLGAGTLLVCLVRHIAATEVEALAAGIVAWHQELAPSGDSQVLFRDSAFANDQVKLNLSEQLRQRIERVQVRSL